MALVSCPKCGKRVSSMASKCGYCGAEMPQTVPHEPAKRSSTSSATSSAEAAAPAGKGLSRILMGLCVFAAVAFGLGIAVKSFLPSAKPTPQVAVQDPEPTQEEPASTEPEEDPDKHILDSAADRQIEKLKKAAKTVVDTAKETAVRAKDTILEAKDKVQENQAADDAKKAELLRLLQEKLAAAEERKAKVAAAQVVLDDAAARTNAAAKAYRESRTQYTKAKTAVGRCERTLRKATKASASAKYRADRTNANNAVTSVMRDSANRSAQDAAANVQAATAAVAKANANVATTKAAYEAAKKTYEQRKAEEKKAEEALDLVSEKELEGPIGAIINTELLLLQQVHVGKVLHIVDGEEIRKPDEPYDVALKMPTDGLAPGAKIKVVVVDAGTWLPDGKTDKSLALHLYEVVDRLE